MVTAAIGPFGLLQLWAESSLCKLTLILPLCEVVGSIPVLILARNKARRVLLIPLFLSFCLLPSKILTAATDSKSLLIKANVGPAAKLIVTNYSITFPNTDPDEQKQIPALENDIKVTVKVRTESSGQVSLKIMAEGDLVSGSDSIPIQNVIWQATGLGFMSGTLSKSSSQAGGSWVGSGIREGFFRYYLNNSWTYPVGNYRGNLTYSLTAP